MSECYIGKRKECNFLILLPQNKHPQKHSTTTSRGNPLFSLVKSQMDFHLIFSPYSHTQPMTSLLFECERSRSRYEQCTACLLWALSSVSQHSVAFCVYGRAQTVLLAYLIFSSRAARLSSLIKDCHTSGEENMFGRGFVDRNSKNPVKPFSWFWNEIYRLQCN